MSSEVVLFLLRVLSALLLIGFLGAIVWFIYQDLKIATLESSGTAQPSGALRVIDSVSDMPAEGSTIPLTSTTTIGRSRSNTLVVDDDFVSSEHVLISRRGTQWWLEDLGSRNGTLLNELPLEEPAVVTAGDVITIGRVRLRVET